MEDLKRSMIDCDPTVSLFLFLRREQSKNKQKREREKCQTCHIFALTQDDSGSIKVEASRKAMVTKNTQLLGGHYSLLLKLSGLITMANMPPHQRPSGKQRVQQSWRVHLTLTGSAQSAQRSSNMPFCRRWQISAGI